MEITNVSVMPLTHGKFDCIAICQFTIDNSFIITGLKLYEKNGKRYLVFPKNEHNRKQMKYCHPIDDNVYNSVLSKVNIEYNRIKTEEDPMFVYKEFNKEEEFYKKNFGVTCESELYADLARRNSAAEAEFKKNVEISEAAQALDANEAAKALDILDNNDKFWAEQLKNSKIDKYGNVTIEDNYPEISSETLLENYPSIDNEEAIAIETKAMNIDLIKLLLNGTTPEEAKKYLLEKYRNSTNLINQAISIVGENEKEETI